MVQGFMGQWGGGGREPNFASACDEAWPEVVAQEGEPGCSTKLYTTKLEDAFTLTP